MSHWGSASEGSAGTRASSMATITTRWRPPSVCGSRIGRPRSSPTSRQVSGDARDAGGLRRHGDGAGGQRRSRRRVLAEISTDYFVDASRRHPTRVVNIGIIEQAMVGVAAGFAMEGFHPIAHSLSPFMAERPYEQLKLDFGYQGLGGTFVGVGGSYDYAGEGGTHHAPADASLMLAIPGWRCSSRGTGRGRSIAARDVRERATRHISAPRRHERRSVRCRTRADRGRARGAGPTLVAFGPMLDRVLAASEGVDVTVAYATSLAPFDHAGVRSIAGGSPRVIVVEPFYQGTSAPVLAETFRGEPAALASSASHAHSYTATALRPISTPTSASTSPGSGSGYPRVI